MICTKHTKIMLVSLGKKEVHLEDTNVVDNTSNKPDMSEKARGKMVDRGEDRARAAESGDDAAMYSENDSSGDKKDPKEESSKSETS